MKLTNRNYYSKKANMQYLSVSQYKDFIGAMGYCGCEYKAMAKLKGEFKEEPTTALLQGSYIDSAYEGKLRYFIKKHPEMFTKQGVLKAEYQKAQIAFERCKKDKLFELYMSGKKQVIMTAPLFGADWKIKIDSFHFDKCIVDLKFIKDIHERFWIKDLGYYINFIENWGYDFQLAIYQLVVEYNTGKKLPCYIAAVDKKQESEIELIQVTQEQLDASLLGIGANVKRILSLKKGLEEPVRCNKCNYCVKTKILTNPVTSDCLIEI